MRTMMPGNGSANIRHEARLLYTLLDAAASAGHMDGTPVLMQWQEANTRAVRTGDLEAEAELFQELMSELDARHVLADTWIGARWHTIQERVER